MPKLRDIRVERDKEPVMTPLESIQSQEQTPLSVLTEPNRFEENNISNRRNSYLSAMGAFGIQEAGLDVDAVNEFKRNMEQSYADPTHEGLRTKLSNEIYGKLGSDLATTAEEMALEEPSLANDTRSAAAEAQQALDQRRANSPIEEIIMDGFGVPEEKRNEFYNEGFNMYAHKDIQKLMDGMSTTDKIVNYAGLFFISDLGLDLGRVLDTTGPAGGLDFTTFIRNFNALSGEEKLRLWPTLRDAVHEATDENNVKTAHILSMILDPTADMGEIKTTVDTANAFLTADTLTLGASIVTKLAKIGKTTNAIYSLKKLGRTDKAAALNATAAIDDTGEVAKNIGVSKEAIEANGTPFNWEAFMADATDGLNSGIQALKKELGLARNKTFQDLQRVYSEDETFRQGILLPEQQKEVQARALSEIDKIREERYASGWTISEAKVTQSDSKGFTLEYDYDSVPIKREIEYVLDDAGALIGSNEVGAFKGYVTSPATWMKSISEDIVNSATHIELAKDKILHLLNNRMDEILRTNLGRPLLNKKSYDRLDRVMLAGDEYLDELGKAGKVYTPDELTVQGVKALDGSVVRLNEKEMKAYYELRDLFDNLYVLKNEGMRRALKVQGIKAMTWNGKTAMGKPYETWENARTAMETAKKKHIYDPTANKGIGGIVDTHTVDFERMYQKGYQVVKFHGPEGGAQKVHGEFVTHTFIKRDKITDLPVHVVKYKHGYVPKIDKNGHYFVKENIRGKVDGVENSIVGTRTLRIFDNKKGAEAFLQSLKAKNPDAALEYSLLHNRQMQAMDLANESVGISGGLFTSPRSTHPIFFNEAGVPRERISTFEALQRNIQHIAGFSTRNEWRMGMQRTWINTARQSMKDHKVGIRDVDGFHSALSGDHFDKRYVALDRLRSYINDQARIPTREEEFTGNLLRQFVEWAEKPVAPLGVKLAPAKLPKAVRNWTLHLSEKDPYALARSLSFNTLLGFWNPAQLWVQAQGFSIAASIYPETFAKAARMNMSLRAIQTLGRDAPKEIIARAARGSGISVKEMEQLHKIWVKSGLYESVKNTADHAAAAQGFGFGLGALRKAADKGLYFYKAGELFTRRHGLATAFLNFKKANPKANMGKLTEAQMRTIFDDAMKVQLNLTRANRARWQQGIFSLPTQFMQIQAKFLERFLGKDLTGVQKAKLASIQFMMYGAAGVPLGHLAMNEFSRVTGVGPEDISPEQKAFLRGGFWDAMAYAAIGANVELGARGAIANDIFENLYRTLTFQDPTVGQALFGAFGSLAAPDGHSRISQIWKSLYPMAKAWVVDEDTEFTASDLKFIANEMGKFVSTWRNIDKAIFIKRMGMVIDKHGRVTYEVMTDPEANQWGTIFAQGMGFNLAKIDDIYEAKNWIKEREEHMNTVVDTILQIHYAYLSNPDREGPESDRLAKNFEKMVQLHLAAWNADQQKAIRDKVVERLTDPKTEEYKVVDKLFKSKAAETSKVFQSIPVDNTVFPYGGDEE